MSTVFLYEDERDFRDAATAALSEAGYRVVSAYDEVSLESAIGDVAATCESEGELKALVVDLFATFDGFQVIRRLEERAPATADVPLVIWTDNPNPESHPNWASLGARQRDKSTKSQDVASSAKTLVALIDNL